MYIPPMEYQRIHQDIMNLDQQIRLVTICDISGKIIFSDHRSGVKNLLTPEESKRSLEMAVNAWKERSKLSSKIGRGNMFWQNTRRSSVSQCLLVMIFIFST